jgi:hypothetical protein
MIFVRNFKIQQQLQQKKSRPKHTCHSSSASDVINNNVSRGTAADVVAVTVGNSAIYNKKHKTKSEISNKQKKKNDGQKNKQKQKQTNNIITILFKNKYNNYNNCNDK